MLPSAERLHKSKASPRAQRIRLLELLVGNGVRLLDHPGTEPVDLERTRVIEEAG
jgi:hypothetical protein